MTRLTFGVLMAAVATAACGSSTTATTTAPTPTTFASEYSGTLTPNGAQTFPFAVLTPGSVSATIPSLSPDSATNVGFGLGLWDGSSCQAQPGIWKDTATQGSAVGGNVTAVSTLCLRIYDSTGTLPQPEDFVITVTHS
jgi:hypothetical protein